jgi:hypothetical protein
VLAAVITVHLLSRVQSGDRDYILNDVGLLLGPPALDLDYDCHRAEASGKVRASSVVGCTRKVEQKFKVVILRSTRVVGF